MKRLGSARHDPKVSITKVLKASSMPVRLLRVFLLVLLSGLPVQAQGVDAAAVTATLRIPEMIAVMQDEGIAYGNELEEQLFPGAGGAIWDQTVRNIYDEPALLQRFEDGFTQRLASDPQAVAQIDGFFGSARGQHILLLEIAARRALLDDSVAEAALIRLGDMRATNDPRLGLLERFAAANDLIEQNVSAALNANLAFYRGMAEGGAFDDAKLTEAEMLADVWSQEPGIRAETEDWLLSFLALAYEPLSDEDLQDYIAFSETGASRMMNTAMFAAFDEVFSTISQDLGRAAAEMLAGQDI